jgi:drug/metabolite transporter (DMT)-like permease
VLPANPGPQASDARSYLAGVGYGLTLALCGGLYTTFARHGVLRGLSPYDLTAMRFGVAAILFAPVLAKTGVRDFGGLGWKRSLALTACAGPIFSLLVFTGFRFAPLSHGGVIMPAAITLSGILMSAMLFGDRLGPQRWLGLLAIFGGLAVLGGDAMLHGSGNLMLAGDFMFFLSGACWAGFGVLVRLWHANPIRASAVISLLSTVIFLPFYFAFADLGGWARAGSGEIVLQLLVQGVLAGAGNLITYAKAVEILGPGRAALFPSLVPALSVLIAIPLLAEIPNTLQWTGLVVISAGLALSVVQPSLLRWPSRPVKRTP